MWIAPPADRLEVPLIADERAMLEAWLDFHRATLLQKCTGLTGEQLATPAVPPWTLSLLGLVRHMGAVERGWFRGGWQGDVVQPLFAGSPDPDADFNDLDPARAEEDFALFRAEVEAAGTEAARHRLDDVTRAPWRVTDVSLRWIYLHMIEEYARHNGHADLLRERIDGETGD